jgi:starch phosphorylase
MRPAYSFAVQPRMPENLKFLSELAFNLWWDWNFDALDLFRRLSPQTWIESNQNPVQTLLRTEQARLDYMSTELGFLNHLERVKDAFDVYMHEPRWFQRRFPEQNGLLVAYYSAEFGLSRSLQIYSGGLGILAGDHLKTASDMGLPLVGISLGYRFGYFHQYLNLDGWQQERYDENDFRNLPVKKVREKSGDWLTFEVPYLNRPVRAALWNVQVGRVPLYLITTNLAENSPEDRAITDQLYGGDREMRIRQEIVLGIGGTIALQRLGLSPTVYHMNEGHSAFLSLEQIEQLMAGNLGFAAALEVASARNCFTTHTPVPAGNDVFAADLVQRYLKPLSDNLGLAWDAFVDMGQDLTITDTDQYCMPVVALKTAQHSNAVSQLHGEVARGMWNQIWPGVPETEVPIRGITNGIHLHTWISPDMGVVFDRYLGSEWRRDPLQERLWERLRSLPDEELWRVHERRRTRLVVEARERLEQQLRARGAAQEEIKEAVEILSPEALTIGFARRFATYKRATLLFGDLDRLKRLLQQTQQPVQFIFAGKAHPRDDEGKKLIRDIIHACHDKELRTRCVFLEDYDMHLSRYMVQGVDIWLNTPRRPLEASGTSGMKAVANGAIHVSTLDGWWAESYTPEIGWAIGRGEEYSDLEYQDRVEGEALYDILEREIVPLFYKRNVAQLPKSWIGMMRRSMIELIPRFSSHRMLADYICQSYLGAHKAQAALTAESYAGAQQLAEWRERVLADWAAVKIESITEGGSSDAKVGDTIDIRATIDPGALSPEDLAVEVFHGNVAVSGELAAAQGHRMELAQSRDGRLYYETRLPLSSNGYYGFTVRVYPSHPLLGAKFVLHKMSWYQPS